jgi:hypothetical protein
MEEKNNGVSNHLRLVRPPTATCPACGSKIPHEKFEEILCLSEARDLTLARERALLEEREAKVDVVVRDAVATEQAKWSAVAAEVTQQVEQLKTTHAAALEKVAAAHEEQIEAEVRRRTVTMEKLERDREVFRKAAEREKQAKETMMKRFFEKQQRERVAVEARANAAADRRIKAAEGRLQKERRAAIDEQAKLVANLQAEAKTAKAETKTAESRRRREQEAFKRSLAEMQRKAERRDQMHHGPAGEEALVALLREEFPEDRIEHTGTGGDVRHVVIDRGREIGCIVLECKNTRSWSADYVKQTARAMEHHHTTYAVLCSRTLPARQSMMCVKNGVVIVVPEIVGAVVRVLRDGIVALARMSAGSKDRAEKEAALVDYLRSNEFAGAIKRVGAKIAEARGSLEREKSAHVSTWTLREQTYLGVVRETAAIDARVTELLTRVGGEPANDNTKEIKKEKM